jgi:hypothetical protein
MFYSVCVCVCVCVCVIFIGPRFAPGREGVLQIPNAQSETHESFNMEEFLMDVEKRWVRRRNFYLRILILLVLPGPTRISYLNRVS